MRVLPIRSRRLIAICGKCGRKLHGGFGSDGDKSLVKSLRRLVPEAKGKRAILKIIETKCLDICPKRAVAMIDSDNPGEVLIVPARTPTVEVAAQLSLSG